MIGYLGISCTEIGGDCKNHIVDRKGEHLCCADEIILLEQENPRKDKGVKDMAFTVGDKVEVVECQYENDSHVGKIWTLKAINDDGTYYFNEFGCSATEVKLISNAKETMAIRELPEELEHADADSQALYQVGVIDSCLKGVSTAGYPVVEALLKLNYKALADQARATIAKEKAKAEKVKKA